MPSLFSLLFHVLKQFEFSPFFILVRHFVNTFSFEMDWMDKTTQGGWVRLDIVL